MVKAELSYNPYLLETTIRFNDEKPMINSLVEKYENKKLQDWLVLVPQIFYDEMNGYDFDLIFSGTLFDYEELIATFEKTHVSQNQVRIIHKNELEDVQTKDSRVHSLLDWLQKNPNRQFNNGQFRESYYEAFDETYSLVSIMAPDIEANVFEGLNIAQQNIDCYDEIPAELPLTPVLINSDGMELEKLQLFIKKILSHSEVSQNQLFFLISPRENFSEIERNLIDLGVKNPQIVYQYAEKIIKQYIEVFPMTEYISQAIKIFNGELGKLQSKLNKVNETSLQANQSVYQKIDSFDDAIKKLKRADEFFIQKDNFEIPSEFYEAKHELIAKIQNWRKKKIKLSSDKEAEKEIENFSHDLNLDFAEYVSEIETIFSLKVNNMEQSFTAIYEEAGYSDSFQIDPIEEIGFENFELTDLREDFRNFRREEAVKKSDDLLDLINPFAKKNPNAPLEMVQKITYLYQDFREKAVETINPLAENIISLCAEKLLDYYYSSATQYSLHLKHLIRKLSEEKNEVALQLSADEQELQRDNDWFVEFSDQVNAIGRG